jgi:hypothetical protein
MTDEGRYEVVWPLGREVGPGSFAPRLGDLDRAVVAELWDNMYRGDEGFPILRDELRRRHPGLTVIPYSEFGNIHGADEHTVLAELPARLREQGCHGVIAGVGH